MKQSIPKPKLENPECIAHWYFSKSKVSVSVWNVLSEVVDNACVFVCRQRWHFNGNGKYGLFNDDSNSDIK